MSKLQWKVALFDKFWLLLVFSLFSTWLWGCTTVSNKSCSTHKKGGNSQISSTRFACWGTHKWNPNVPTLIVWKYSLINLWELCTVIKFKKYGLWQKFQKLCRYIATKIMITNSNPTACFLYCPFFPFLKGKGWMTFDFQKSVSQSD